MPASRIDLYHMQDTRNNFDAMRPAPVCDDANQYMGQCQNVHVSTNCYYGYHDPKSMENAHVPTDCEMLEAPQVGGLASESSSPQSNARKRSAADGEYPLNKRLREVTASETTYTTNFSLGHHAASTEMNNNSSLEVQREKSIEPETTENKDLASREDLLESLYWNIHGGNIFHLIQCL